MNHIPPKTWEAVKANLKQLKERRLLIDAKARELRMARGGLAWVT